MAVHIRLTRAGAKKRPYYRLIVTDHHCPQGGRCLENIGTFDPIRQPAILTFDAGRLAYWSGVGATPSATVARLLKRARSAPVAPATSTPTAAS